MAVVDFFLKIDGIDGESKDAKKTKWIDVESWGWGATQSGTQATGGGGGAGKVSMQDIHFTAHHCAASPKLMLACASGEHIKTAQLVARKAGKDQQEYMKIKLTDLLVSSYQTGGSSSSSVLPIDQFSLNFAKVEVEYSPQNENGSLGAAVKSGWDVKANQKV